MIIALSFILMGIIFMIFTMIYVKNKNSLQGTKKIDNSNLNKNKKTIKNLWGIDDVKNDIISINKQQHSIIVELESIEYNLLHDSEKNSVDRELISIAQMLKFPIQFLEIKQNIDMRDNIENIRLNTLNANSQVKEYARYIINHLEKLQENQSLFERKNYMIISSFNNKRQAEVELKDFYQLLKYHLINIKVNVRLLNDIEILELIYNQLHKGNFNKVEKVRKKGGLELYVKSKKREED